MSSKDPTFQNFQALESEKKEQVINQQKSYEGKIDPRLITFCVTNFVINVGISQIAPFYPDLAANKAHLSYSEIGLVLGINPLGSIVMSIIIGSKMMVWGRKRCLIVALIGQSIVLTLFGLLNYMTGSKGLFLTMSMTTRILQGASRAVYSTVTFAYVPIFWPNEFQKKLAIMETMTALGLLFGPIVGSILNSIFGYSVPFFMIAIFFLVSIIPLKILIPSDDNVQTIQKKQKVPMGKAFRSIKVIITVLNITIICTGYIFFNPFFINHMASFGYSPNIGAYVLTIPSFFYIVNVNLVPRLQKKCQKTFLMSLALLICFFGNMLEAPFWGVTNDIAPVVFGLMFVGIAQAFSTLPSIPQLIEFLTPIINDPTIKAGVSDIASSLFMMSMSLGSLIGPLLGGSVYDKFGGNVNWSQAITKNGHITNQTLYDELCYEEKQAFRKSLMVLGCMQLGAGILFFIFADGYKGWQDLFRRLSNKNNSALNQPFLNTPTGINNENLRELSIQSENLEEQLSLEQVKITREK